MFAPCNTCAYEHVVENRLENDREILSAAGQCLRDGDTAAVFYVTGRNYVPEGTVLKNFYGDSLEYSVSLERTGWFQGEWLQTMRFAVKWKDFEGSGNQEGSESIEELPSGSVDDIRYWKIGDRISREIDGKFFAFRCIDQNYYGAEDSGQAGALFLCDQVIPWDYGSCSAYEKLEDGSYGYVYHKGPIEAFGRNEEYKYSAVREYLGQVAKEWEEQGYQMKNVRTGRTYTYTGQTKERSFEQFSEQDLTAHPSSYQQMTDRVFLLSVEEAIRYRDELWKFSGMEWLRPASTRYWLRTAMGREGGEGTGQAYAVDLVKGCIAPVDVGDTCGIRPAFVVTQAASR